MNLPYEDKTSTVSMFPFALISMLAGVSGFFIYKIMFSARGIDVFTFGLWVTVSMFCLFFLTKFVYLNVRVERKNLVVTWGIFGESIPVSEIYKLKIKSAGLMDFFASFLSLGITKNHKEFVNRSGRGVEVKVRGGKSYFISTDRPEELVSIIQKARAL